MIVKTFYIKRCSAKEMRCKIKLDISQLDNTIRTIEEFQKVNFKVKLYANVDEFKDVNDFKYNVSFPFIHVASDISGVVIDQIDESFEDVDKYDGMYIVTLQVIQYIANTVTLEYNAKQILENKHNEEVVLKHIRIKDNEVVYTIHSFMDFLKREYANYFKIIKYEDISTTFEDEDILKKKALKYILE